MNVICSSDKTDRAVNLKAYQLKNEIILKTKSIKHDSERLKKLCNSDIVFIIRTIEIANLILEGSDKLFDLQCEYQNSEDDYVPNIEFMEPIFKKMENKMNEINEHALDLQI